MMRNTGFRGKKFGVAGKTATVVTSVVLAAALIVTIASGLIPGTVLKAEALSAAVIESEYGENYIPSTYTAVNVPAGTLTMTADQYASNTFNSGSAAQTTQSDGLAVFDFHIFAENFASGIHTCGNIAVENLGVSIGSTSGAPEFGSRVSHQIMQIRTPYFSSNIHSGLF